MPTHAAWYWSLLPGTPKNRRQFSLLPIARSSLSPPQSRISSGSINPISGLLWTSVPPGNVILSTQINNQYRLLTGTSMASPHVAGVAALMLAKRPALTHEEVRHILINTADPVRREDSEELDERFVGAGTVNAERALLASGALQARILAPGNQQRRRRFDYCCRHCGRL